MFGLSSNKVGIPQGSKRRLPLRKILCHCSASASNIPQLKTAIPSHRVRIVDGASKCGSKALTIVVRFDSRLFLHRWMANAIITTFQIPPITPNREEIPKAASQKNRPITMLATTRSHPFLKDGFSLIKKAHATQMLMANGTRIARKPKLRKSLVRTFILNPVLDI